MERRRLFRLRLALLAFALSLATFPAALQAQPKELQEQVRKIAADLRCPVCQNLSVADSPSELAQQMRAAILRQLKEGKSPEQIKSYFVSKYGEWVLLSPRRGGFSLLVWILPFIALAGGILLVLFAAGRWVRRKKQPDPAPVEPSLIERVRREMATPEDPKAAIPAENPQGPLLIEKGRLYAEIRELDFDYQAGRLSQADYQELRQRYEAQAATLLKQIDSSSPSPISTPAPPKRRAAKEKRTVQPVKSPFRRSWAIAVGGAFLLLFGVTLGVMLGKSLRPRGSVQESITGDFLTGSAPATSGTEQQKLRSLLEQGRASFERQDWSKAIDAFKKALAIDPRHPEAHAYLGMILIKAGHSDAALLAFNRALSSNPNFPLALWGKGMVLYQDKEDLKGARASLEKLASLLPPGKERDQIEDTLQEIRNRQATARKEKPLQTVSQRIEGTITIDPKFQKRASGHPVLFIIVRSTNARGGPPLAVKRIKHPVFPLSYSLGPEDTMIPGRSLTGKVVVSARLDRDGNPMTRETGNLSGRYKANPVEVGSRRVDITLDRLS